MDEIDFSDNLPTPDKLKRKVIRLVSFIVTLLILTIAFTFIEWNVKKNSLISLIEMGNAKDARILLNSLKGRFLRFNDLKIEELRLSRIEFNTDLNRILSYYSKYNDPFTGVQLLTKDRDSIQIVLNNLREIELKFSGIIDDNKRFEIVFHKLLGLTKLLLSPAFPNAEKLIYIYELGKWEEPYRTFGNDYNLNQIVKYEKEVLDILESDDYNKFKRDEGRLNKLNYIEFLVQPSIDNLNNFLGELSLFSSEQLKYEYGERLKLVLYRLVGENRPDVGLKVRAGLPNIDEGFHKLEEYVSNCINCPDDYELYLLYFQYAGVGDFKQRNSSQASPKLTDNRLIEQAFYRSIYSSKKAYSSRYEYLKVIRLYAQYLSRNENINELFKFRNQLPTILENKGFNEDEISSLRVDGKLNIASVFLLDSEIRWKKKDFEAVDLDYTEINNILNLTSLIVDGFYLNTIKLPSVIYPSYILRNWWAVKVNLDQQDACSFLRKASDLNPEDFYEEYLKNCLSK